MTSDTKYTPEDIKRFIINKTGCEDEEVQPDTDIDTDLGCTGNDFDELINEYAVKFNVNMDGYLWYFHTYEEGHSNSIGRMFFKAPTERIQHIAVTPALLLESANAGKWRLIYPGHRLPKQRYDILVNQVVLILFILFIIYKCTS
ncbi:MAG: DUF1493 family protein [Agriterribacter sp.]